jgi:hypothetical protein
MALLLQLVITGIWASTVLVHTRRLFRLACVSQLSRWDEQVRLRSSLSRMWWWLGQDEFWRGVRPDCLRAIELSLIIFLLAWSVAL